VNGAMEKLQYPIGRFSHEGEITPEQRELWINEITEVPRKLRLAVKGLSESELNTPYRPGGWTIRQVVHHLADSHMNSYIRFKLALTEELPTIKPYEEARWAELSDSANMPIEVSLQLLESLHLRWVNVLRSIPPEDFNRSFIHPESGVTPLARNLGIYAWHGNHHIAHITSLRERMGWKYSKADLLEQFAEWLLFMEQLKTINERQWSSPLNKGKWSIRDIVSHIMLWDRFFHEGSIDKIASGHPLSLHMTGMDFNEFNHHAIEFSRKQQKNDLIEQSKAIRSTIITQLEQIDSSDYHKEYIDGDGNPFVIYEYLLDFIGHDWHHTRQIRLS
jgi:uncharacterized damage-inducible protein DinB